MALANLALRFLLELGGATAAGAAAYMLTGSNAGPLRWVAAIGAAAAVIAFWSLVVAPKAANGLSQPQKDLIGTAVLLLAAAALAMAGQMPLALGYGVLVVANAALLFILRAGDVRIAGVLS